MRKAKTSGQAPLRQTADIEFGPEQITEMNASLPDSTLSLFLPPDFDRRFVPVKAKALRSWWEDDDKSRMHARFCLPITMAAGLGYYILSPATFTIEWDGSDASDVEVTVVDAASHAVIDNHSTHGSFTVQARFIPRTKNIGDYVYVRGVANQRLVPYHVMEAMIEAWWTPSEFGIVCIMNQAGKFTIKKGEPLAQISVVNLEQAKYSLAVTDGYPPHWDAWTERRNPEIYDGKNMDYLQGRLPDGKQVCPHFKAWPGAYVHDLNNIHDTSGGSETIHEANGGKEAAAAQPAKKADKSGHSEFTAEGAPQSKQSVSLASKAVTQKDWTNAIRHTDKAITSVETEKSATVPLLTEIFELASKLADVSELEASKNILHKCLALNDRFCSSKELDAKVFARLSDVFRSLGKLDSAFRYGEEALRVKRELNAGAHSIALALLQVGTICDVLQRHADAERYELEADKLLASVLKPEHTDRIWCTNVIACLYSHQGKFTEAAPLYQDVIQKKSKLYGEESVEVSVTYDDLGFHYHLMGKLDQAADQFRRALEIRKKILGPDHMDVATLHDRMGWIYSELGDFESARDSFIQCLRIMESHLSAKDSRIKDSRARLGHVYKSLGDNAQAELNFKKSRS